MYIMFPIGIMYYFGTNLDSKFSVEGFWPKAEETNRVPTEKEDIDSEMERLKLRRLELRKRRLAMEQQGKLEEQLELLKAGSASGKPTWNIHREG